MDYNPGRMPSLDIVIPACDAAAHVAATLEAALDQAVPAGLGFGVIVADAGSTDATPDIVAGFAGRGVRLVRAEPQRNRAAARNAGVAASRADYVLLLDADCRLLGTGALAVAAAAIGDGVGAAFGTTTGTGDSLLARYQARLERRRRATGWTGWTTACCLVRRSLFERVGGYSVDYTHYGFEDRDFICRLLAADERGELRPEPRLRAAHDGLGSVAEIRGKMYAAGRYSSGLFRRRFPAAYAELAYARIDAATAAAPMRAVLAAGSVIERPLAGAAGWLLRRRRLPLAIGAPLLRLVSALSFYRGTRDAAA